ncbi:MAG: hypothetical protein KF724_12580 [Phycisphaeraceae bacterium]|nr:hypothetical protein [Phycisphaeraceae bacterium]
MKCGYALLAGQKRCPECGVDASAPRARYAITQLQQAGPSVVWPIAIRFALMGGVAAMGPLIVIVGLLLHWTLDFGPGVSFGAAIKILMGVLPVVVLLSMPIGPGALGGESSPVEVTRAKLLGQPIHLLALAFSLCWWIFIGVITYGAGGMLSVIIALLALVGAGASAYLHLCWMADLGLAIADEGPHTVLNICVGTALLTIIIALLVAFFVASLAPFFLAIAVIVLAVILGEIVVAIQLSRDMMAALVGAYEEVARAQRRAERAREERSRLP